MGKKIIILLLVVSVLLTLSMGIGCKAAPARKELSGTITMWYFPPTLSIFRDKLFPEFQKIYPNAKLKTVSVDWPDVHTKFLISFAAGSGFPDTFDCFAPIFNGYQQAGALLDITKWMKPHMNEFPKSALDFLTVDGRIYGVPWGANGAVMYYRKDVFEDAGIDPVDSMKTWKGWFEAGKKIFEQTNGKVKLTCLAPSGAADWAMERIALMIMEQRGSDFYDAYGNPVINSKENKEIFEFLKEVMDSGITLEEEYWSPANYAAFENGEIATVPQACWMDAEIKMYDKKNAGNWRVMLLPAWEEGGNRYAENGGGGSFPVCSLSKNPELVFRFLEFIMIDKDNLVGIAKTGGDYPMLLSAWEDPFFDERDPYYGGQRTRKIYKEVGLAAEPLHFGPNWPEATASVVRITTDYFNGRISIDNALSELEKELAKVK